MQQFKRVTFNEYGLMQITSGDTSVATPRREKMHQKWGTEEIISERSISNVFFVNVKGD